MKEKERVIFLKTDFGRITKIRKDIWGGFRKRHPDQKKAYELVRLEVEGDYIVLYEKRVV